MGTAKIREISTYNLTEGTRIGEMPKNFFFPDGIKEGQGCCRALEGELM